MSPDLHDEAVRASCPMPPGPSASPKRPGRTTPTPSTPVTTWPAAMPGWCVAGCSSGPGRCWWGPWCSARHCWRRPGEPGARHRAGAGHLAGGLPRPDVPGACGDLGALAGARPVGRAPRAGVTVGLPVAGVAPRRGATSSSTSPPRCIDPDRQFLNYDTDSLQARRRRRRATGHWASRWAGVSPGSRARRWCRSSSASSTARRPTRAPSTSGHRCVPGPSPTARRSQVGRGGDGAFAVSYRQPDGELVWALVDPLFGNDTEIPLAVWP